jgi:type VI secretion system secreted protein VgrG
MTTATLSSDKRPIQATTPMGKDLVAISFTGEEALSQPFLFTIDFLSTNYSVSADKLLGKAVSMSILPVDGGSKPRLVHGVVRRFVALGRDAEFAHYRAEVVPALWFLTLSTDCRIFEGMTTVEIVTKVCKDANVTDVKSKVTANALAIPYVAQYRETNFDFVSRLLEEAGLYYTFEHTASAHTLVISDAVGSSVPPAVVSSVEVGARKGVDGWPPNVVVRVAREFALHTGSVLLTNHGLLVNDVALSAASKNTGARGERFDFMGTLTDPLPPDSAKQRIEIEEGTSAIVRGASTASGLQAGTRSMLEGGEFGHGTELHFIHVTHRMTGGDVFASQGTDFTYENDFVAIPVKTRFRPPHGTPRPVVLGTHVAKVVGSGNAGEIDVDADGRILLEFPWDRGDTKGGKTKHRVHVASSWAGAGWGFVQIPRVGQEVLVEFLDGDVNHPIVTGRVYNHAHKAPYALPANRTQSGLMSRTVGGGADNFNELRFEDKKGEEHLYAQAEKDLKVLVKNDETRDVKHDRITTVKHDDTRTVSEGNDAQVVSKGNQTITISEGKQEIIVAKGDQIVSVSKGKQTTTVHGDHTLTVEQGTRKSEIKTGDDTLEVAMGALTTTVKTGDITMKASLGEITIEAMKKITLKVGANSIEIGPAGITIKGVKVSVEANAQAEVKGAMVTVQAQAMMQVKGAITQVAGDGMLTLKGGITMIN